MVLWTDLRKGLWDEFWNVHLLMAEFDCPEVTLCGWQDVKIQWLTQCLVPFQFLTQATQDEIQRIRSSTLSKKKARDQAVTEKTADSKVLPHEDVPGWQVWPQRTAGTINMHLGIKPAI